MSKSRKAVKNTTNRLSDQNNVLEGSDATMEYDATVSVVDSGASQTFPVQASALRKNGYAMLKGNPSKIVDISTSKPGKHGHAKMVIVGLDLFTGKKYEHITPSSHTMDVVDMADDGYMSLLDEDGKLKCDVCVKDDGMSNLRDKLEKKGDSEIMVTILQAMDKEMVMSIKVTK